MTKPTLSLIIPALNETKIIMPNVHELQAWMTENLPDISYEVIVVNDGSTDGMGEMLEEECKNNSKLRVLHHRTNIGRGRAVRTGIENTQSDYLITLDADLSYSPDHIKPLLEPLMAGRTDLTLASPYHASGVVENVPTFRAWLSKWGNRVLSGAFESKAKTVTCIVRGYTRDLMDHLELVNNGKDFHLEVLYKTELLGFRVEEVPAKLIWRDKNRGRVKQHHGNIITRNSLYRMRRSIFSHLVFNFFSRPQLLFILPMLILLGFIIFGTANIVFVWVELINSGQSIMSALRTALLDGQLTLQIVAGSTILFFTLMLFFFLASQSKKYFEELYTQNARINVRLKRLQKSEDN